MPVQALTRRVPPAVLTLIAAGLLASCATSPARSSQLEVLSGEAYSAEGAISIQSGDHTYGVPLDVSWTDTDGNWHTRGRPDCLQPSQQTIPVKFAAIEVTVQGVTWRPVVWVSCQL